jgi:hypothetical protein
VFKCYDCLTNRQKALAAVVISTVSHAGGANKKMDFSADIDITIREDSDLTLNYIRQKLKQQNPN